MTHIDLQSTLNSINDNINKLEQTRKDIKNNKDTISDTRIFLKMSGLDNTKVAQLLYDTKLDHSIDNMVNMFMQGDYKSIAKYSDVIAKVFSDVGLGKGSFSGPVSQIFVQNLLNSIDSMNFNKTNDNIKKMMIVLKNMKKQTKTIQDKEVRKKYKEAVKAFRKIISIISKTYKNRRIIATGLHNMVNESYNPTMTLNISSDESLEAFDQD
jgi:hypothetical protein